MAESPASGAGQTLDSSQALDFPAPITPPRPQPAAVQPPPTGLSPQAPGAPSDTQPGGDPLAELTTLYELTERLTAANGLDDALHRVLEAGAALLGAQRGMLLLAEPPEHHSAAAAASAFGTVDAPGSTVGFGLDRPALGALETVPRESGPYAALLSGSAQVLNADLSGSAQVLNADLSVGCASPACEPCGTDRAADAGVTAEASPAAGATAEPALVERPKPDLRAVDVPAVDVPAVDVPAVDFPAVDLCTVGLSAADVSATDLSAMERFESSAPGERFREVARHLGIGASYALPLTAPGEGQDPFGTAVWFYDAPAVPTPRAQRLAGLYCSAASRLIAKEMERDRLVRTAEALRRGLLPDRLPRVPGIQLAARCLPAGLDLSSGSDWYDALQLPDNGLALSVGSVNGGGADCAAAMGRIRAALRAYAVLEGEDPVSVLGDLELLLKTTEPARTATALYAYLDPRTRQLSLAGAGQCPPLLVTSFGASFVETSLSAPLGMLSCWEAPGVELRADRGDLLLLYTEGLARRCGTSLHAGQARLRAAAAGATREDRQDPERFCAHLLSSCLDVSRGGPGSASSTDDIVLLAARFE